MKISLIIPAYNEEKYIGNCLSSIQKYGDGLFETIVINNASTDNTENIIKNFQNVRLVNEPRKGLPFARNRGIHEAKGDIIAFVDADSMIRNGWVEKIMHEFSNNNIVSLSGPYIYYDVSIFKKILVWMYLIMLAWPSYLIVGYMSITGNFVVRKKAINQIDGFNENILFYGDDVDIAKRLSKIGKVKFSLPFYLFSSARRLNGEGSIITAYRYIINYIWIVWKNKPKTNTYKNIR